jgi:hypothetical protein
MSKAGTMRAREFRWEDHFQALLDLAEGAAH